ncbi:HNH endonuclease signature motif containing protein [Klenkia taihuensis]|uniref:HNH nuclease domain-containing protein n=1 Tax=Klenkia taihuensis TaxID=1225127 RepID=A0A1I1R0H2_9ACTN|nr:HNH endonuclease signature motif containing protein [Klenkia taihuensis]GHE07634.1 hypothetical protein GCM10011381_04880 [Klenkia taihuensis]SFD23770.1 protein of unknown function [Klenkia taihuensis]
MALEGRFAVEVTTRFTPAGWVAPDLPPVVAPRLTETAAAFGLTGAALDAEIASVRAKRSELAAYEAGLIERKATQGAQHALPLLPGARTDVGGGEGEAELQAADDFLPDEVAVLLRCSVTSARHLVEHALVLVRQLPVVWHALADGRIDESRARVICEVLRWQATSVGGPFADDAIDELAARAVGWAERGCPPTTLRERLQAGLVALDPEAADRRRRARVDGGDVTTTPTGDGTSELRATGVATERAALIRAQLTAYARKLKADGDPRPLGALRNAVMDALITRPWDTPDPAVAHVTITADLRDLFDPEQLRTLRDLATDDPHDESPAEDDAAPAHDASTDRAQHPTGTGSAPRAVPRRSPSAARHTPAETWASRDTTAQDTTSPTRSAQDESEHREDAREAGGPTGGVGDVAGQPVTPAAVRELLRRIDVLGLVDPATGDLVLTITDRGRALAVASPAELLAAARQGTGLGPPPSTAGYTPTAAQYCYLRARDRHCRFPGCRRDARSCDADHVVPHGAGGRTCTPNLALLCRHHHRLKTHAPGWSFRLDPDGTLHVTTPGGSTVTTRPPGVDEVLDPERPPPPPHDPVDDPPPF